MPDGDFEGLDFEGLDFTGTVDMYVGSTSSPTQFSESWAVTLNELPLDIRLVAPEGQGCAITLPMSTEGEEVTLLSPTGSLDLQLTEDGIQFVIPTTQEQAPINCHFVIGDELAIRPLMAAPRLPEVCRHGISPIRLCPIQPP